MFPDLTLATMLGLAFGGCIAVAGATALSLVERGLWKVLQAALYRRRERWRAVVRRQWPADADREPRALLTEAELLEMPWVANWWAVQLAAAVVGLALAYLVFSETTPEMAFLGLTAFALPRFLLRLRAGNVQWRHRLEIRNFLTMLRLSVSLGETLSRALEDIALRAGEGLFAQRLRYHLRSRKAGQPLPILSALAADFRSPDLETLLLRVEAVQQGGATLEEAVQICAQDIETHMLEEARLSVAQAEPLLLLPMMVGLFFPAMYLILYPMSAFVLAGLGALPQ